MSGKPGRIITFYSYKGVTGRTMVLANVAWILASNGKRVLAVDWDLEAPGLHSYFRPFLLDQYLGSSDGIIDLVRDFAAAAVVPIESATESENGWPGEFVDIFKYVITLRWSFFPPGRLDFLPSGRQGAAYAARVNSFNWQNFYDRLGGGALLESVKARMQQEYDYILIDSRAGVSDTSGICTVQMPDDLVVCFTVNYQSLEGALTVASSVREQWYKARERRARGRILPVLMGAGAVDMDKLSLGRQEAWGRFSPFIEFLPTDMRDEYWAAVEIFYNPWYELEEVLAPFVDAPKTITSLLGATERLTKYLTDGEVVRAIPPSGGERAQVLRQYQRSGQAGPPTTTSLAPSPTPASLSSLGSVFISYSHKDKKFVDRLVGQLSHDSISCWRDEEHILIGDPIARAISEGIQESHMFLIVLTPSSIASKWVKQELDEATHWAIENGKIILPVLAKGLHKEEVPASLRHLMYVDFSGKFMKSYDKLRSSIEGHIQRPR